MREMRPGAYWTKMIEFHTSISAWFLCLSDCPPALWWLCQLEKCRMPLHDAVGVNCFKVATIENQGGSAYGLRSVSDGRVCRI